MKLITRRDKIKTVAARWKEAYQTRRDWEEYDINPPKKEKWKKLVELDLNVATDLDIAEIIGNPTWTSLICEECLEQQDEVVFFLGSCGEIQLCKRHLKLIRKIESDTFKNDTNTNI